MAKKCGYCGDPILKFQETDKTGKYHIGCKRIKEGNMTLEDIFVKHNYRVEKVDGQMVATQARGGLYRGTSAKDVEQALTDGTQEDTVLVRLSTKTKWTPLPGASK